MLTIFGNRSDHCDGILRRSFFRIGGFSLGGTSLSGILRAEQQQRAGASHKSIIMVLLAIVRTLTGARNDHNLHQRLTRWETHPQQGDSAWFGTYTHGGWPSLGAVVAKVQGAATPAVPPIVSLAPRNAESTTVVWAEFGRTPRNLCHALPQSGDRPRPTDPPRSRRTSTPIGRRPRADS